MKDKGLLLIIMLWLITFILPFLLIGLLHGLNFNISNWDSGSCIHYIVSTATLSIFLMIYKIHKGITENI